MQGRRDQDNESWDRLMSDRLAAVNGTSKHHSMPKRPSNLPHVNTPPRSQRIGRPKRQTVPSKKGRPRFLVLLGIFVACGLLAWGIGYAFVNLYLGANASAGAASTASDFLSNLSSRNYDQAFNDLDATITLNLTKDDFRQQVSKVDTCSGQITSFTEVDNSAVVQGNNARFTYNISRSKLSKPYQLQLTLQKDSNGEWNITSYGNNNSLAPSQPPCS